MPALAADGQVAQAEALLAQIPIGTASEVVAMVELLAAVKQRVASDDRRAVARIEATLIADALAKQGDLDEDTLKTLVRHQAQTLVELGQRAEAEAALGGLAKKYPRDGEVQEEFAVLLTSGTDRVSRESAMTKWRDVAQHCRPGSDRWFRAHLAVARLQLELGRPADAIATIKLVAAAQPELGGVEMKARFQQLLAECNRAPVRSPQAKE